MKTISFIVILLLLLSCKIEDRFLIIRDKRYMEPQYRRDSLRYDNQMFNLHRQYFVFNYFTNKIQFNTASINLICESLNDSLLVSHCSFGFQDMGWGAKYYEGDVLSADFAQPLTFFSWDVSEPGIIVSEWEKSPQERKIIKFDCKLKSEYYKYIKKE